MKRIAGTFALLMGLSGCVTFNSPNAQGEKKEAKPGPTPITALPPMPAPGYSTWTPPESHKVSKTSVPNSLAMVPAPMPDLKPVPPGAGPSLPGLPPQMPVAYTPDTPLKPVVEEKGQQVVYKTVEKADGPTLPDLPKIVKERPPQKPKSEPVVENSKPAEPAKPSMALNGNGPLFRMVNTKEITLNFAVSDIGPSGLAAVDLWYTQDGKEWKKQEAPKDAKFYKILVDEEGMYGFTLVARSGIGLGKEPPVAGDQPQVWVIVDLTKPEVKLGEAQPAFKNNKSLVSLKWSASDKNMGSQPVTLSWSKDPSGPWQPIAANLEAVGEYKWEVPAGTPGKIYLKAEATDMAGNTGHAVSEKAILLDNKVPFVVISGVGGNR